MQGQPFRGASSNVDRRGAEAEPSYSTSSSRRSCDGRETALPSDEVSNRKDLSVDPLLLSRLGSFLGLEFDGLLQHLSAERRLGFVVLRSELDACLWRPIIVCELLWMNPTFKLSMRSLRKKKIEGISGIVWSCVKNFFVGWILQVRICD
jgi:hypothetical protein